MLITRYCSRQISSIILSVVTMIVVVVVCNQLAHYLRHAVGDHLMLSTVFELVLLQIPALSGYILPLAIFLAVLLTYSRMYADQEITVLFSSGFSKLRLVRHTLFYGMVTAVIVAALTFWIQPRLMHVQGRLLYDARLNGLLQLLPPGMFSKQHHWTFYAQSSNGRGHLKGIFAVRAPEKGKTKWQLLRAEHARQKPVLNEKASRLVLNNGWQYSGTPGHLDFGWARFHQLSLKLANRPVPYDVMARHKIYALTSTLWKVRNTDQSAAAELHLRLAMPLAVLILSVLAVPLSCVNNRRHRHARLLPAVLIYIVYMNLLLVARAWIKQGIVGASLGMWWVHGIFIALALMLLLLNRRTI